MRRGGRPPGSVPLTEWRIDRRLSPSTKILAIRRRSLINSIGSGRGTSSEKKGREPRCEFHAGTVEQIDCLIESERNLLTALRIARTAGLLVGFQHIAIEHIAGSYRAFLTSPVGRGGHTCAKGQV
jgi:hypothetical protein